MTNMIFRRNPQTCRYVTLHKFYHQVLIWKVHIWKYNLTNQYNDMHPEMSDVPEVQKKEKENLLKLNI